MSEQWTRKFSIRIIYFSWAPIILFYLYCLWCVCYKLKLPISAECSERKVGRQAKPYHNKHAHALNVTSMNDTNYWHVVHVLHVISCLMKTGNSHLLNFYKLHSNTTQITFVVCSKITNNAHDYSPIQETHVLTLLHFCSYKIHVDKHIVFHIKHTYKQHFVVHR